MECIGRRIRTTGAALGCFQLPILSVDSWNALIAGFSTRESSILFLAKATTYACILKTCGSTQDVDMSTKVHNYIASQRVLIKDVVLGTVLVDMYAKCGALEKAQKVLEELPVASWNALIGRCAQQEQVQKAQGCFQRMQSIGMH
ncbi:hypothetical protein GOP47_0030378 [Adiantum capillus-veneris]|nr:hypothetical protein GOP47_0030378 [Adiantum capillus-veneris]